jgi:hypothetical protein
MTSPAFREFGGRRTTRHHRRPNLSPDPRLTVHRAGYCPIMFMLLADGIYIGGGLIGLILLIVIIVLILR